MAAHEDTDDVAGPGPNSTAAAATQRSRGRLPHQLRTLLCERGMLNRADGSAKWSQENTCVLAAVYGPRQAQPRKEDAEQAVVEVVFKPKSGLQDHRDKDFEYIIRTTLEGIIPLTLHPRTSIMVVLQVVQDDGALLSCSLNAACAALIDAGVPMLTSFSSVTTAVAPDGTLLVDPEASEEQAARAVLTLALCHHWDLTQPSAATAGGGDDGVLGVDDRLLLSHSSGVLSSDQLFDSLELAQAACSVLARFGRMSIAKSLQPPL